MMWNWLILAAILFAAEMMTGTLALLFAGAGALAASALAFFMPDALSAQGGIFALATLAGAVIAWRRLRAAKADQTDASGTDMAGQEVVAIAGANVGGHLRVRHRGSDWNARLESAETPVSTGARLTILRQEGATLIVSPAA